MPKKGLHMRAVVLVAFLVGIVAGCGGQPPADNSFAVVVDAGQEVHVGGAAAAIRRDRNGKPIRPESPVGAEKEQDDDYSTFSYDGAFGPQPTY
jgi:hypothetical protein